jgi:hypothetical protein
MKKKTFDCVEMKREGARRVMEKLSLMTREEQLAYWAQRSRSLRERQAALRLKAKSG